MNHVLTNLEPCLEARLRTALREAVAPALADSIRRVSAQPRHIKKLKIQDALAVVQRLSDADVLAGVARSDKRIGVQRAITGHPRSVQVTYRLQVDEMAERLASDDPQGLVPPELVESAEAVDDALVAALESLSRFALTHWLTQASAEVADAAIRRLFAARPATGDGAPLVFQNLTVGSVILAAAAGRLQVSDELRAALMAAHHAGARAKVVSSDVAAYAVLDVPLATALADLGVAVAWDALDSWDEQAVAVLRRSRHHLIGLIQRDMVTDEEILEVTADWPGEAKAKVVNVARSVTVRDALIRSLPAQSAGSLVRLLRTTPDLSTEARLVLLKDADVYDIVAFARGQFSSRPRPGEMTRLVEHLLTERGDRFGPLLVRYLYSTGVDDIVHEGFFELVDETLARLAASAFYNTLKMTQVSDDSLLLKALADRFATRLHTPEQWSTMLRLMPEWEHPVDTLLDAAVALA